MKIGILLATIGSLACGTGFAADNGVPSRTQSINLHAGWNAVFLEVQPERAKPEEAFAGLPVATAAVFYAGRSGAQYLRSPGDAPWREEGWAVWHAPDRPESALSNLHALQAQRPLLVLATSACTWSVSGEARPTVLQWYPDTCTFTGLPVDPAAPPTFAEFFSGSSAHQRARIYHMEDGVWKLVRNPTTDRVRSGEAYWIRTDGGSTYQGPLRVQLPASGDLDFAATLASRSVGLVNDAANSPAQVRIERVAGELMLHQLVRPRSTLGTRSVELPTSLSLGALAAGKTTELRLAPDRDRLTTAQAGALLRVTDGRGTLQWVPVRARRSAADR